MEEHIAEVEILGHKAKVSNIKGRLADSLWRKEDTLAVWLSFDEPVDGTLSLGIELPAKAYSRTEFLDLVVRKGEAYLQESMAKRIREEQTQKGKEERQKALDNLAQRVEAEVTR